MVDPDDTPIESIADEVVRRIYSRGGTTWKWVITAFTVLTTAFSAGMGYVVFLGENTTDGELHREVRSAITRHNGGSHPDEVDKNTNAPVGDHPDMRARIQGNTAAVNEMRNVILPRIESSQRRLEKRSEYQFELGRWQADTLERQRTRRPPPPKPPSLEKLERDLMLGSYDSP